MADCLRAAHKVVLHIETHLLWTSTRESRLIHPPGIGPGRRPHSSTVAYEKQPVCQEAGHA